MRLGARRRSPMSDKAEFLMVLALLFGPIILTFAGIGIVALWKYFYR